MSKKYPEMETSVSCATTLEEAPVAVRDLLGSEATPPKISVSSRGAFSPPLATYSPFPRPAIDDRFELLMKDFIYLKEGLGHRYDDAIHQMNNENSAVIVLGNTKSGKSTLVNYLMGNDLSCTKKGPKLLISKAKEEYDGPKIGIELSSETKYPASWSSKDFINQTIWDCPGFNDTRSATHDIINAFYIKELLIRVKSAKFVIVCDIADIRGNDCTKFKNMLESIQAIFNIHVDDTSKMEYFLNAMTLVFFKTHYSSGGAEEDHEVVSSYLEEVISSNVLTDEWQRKVVEYFVEHGNKVGLFKCIPANYHGDGRDMEVNLIEGINNAQVVKSDVLADVSPVMSDKARVLIYKCGAILYKTLELDSILTLVQQGYAYVYELCSSPVSGDDADDGLKEIKEYALKEIKERLNLKTSELEEKIDSTKDLREAFDALHRWGGKIAQLSDRSEIRGIARLTKFVEDILEKLGIECTEKSLRQEERILKKVTETLIAIKGGAELSKRAIDEGTEQKLTQIINTIEPRDNFREIESKIAERRESDFERARESVLGDIHKASTIVVDDDTRRIVSKVISPLVPLPADEYGRTALHKAAIEGNRSAIEALLSSKRVDPDQKDNSSDTALYFAFNKGDKECIRLLLDAGASITEGEGRHRSVISAIKNRACYESITEYLRCNPPSKSPLKKFDEHLENAVETAISLYGVSLYEVSDLLGALGYETDVIKSEFTL